MQQEMNEGRWTTAQRRKRRLQYQIEAAAMSRGWEGRRSSAKKAKITDGENTKQQSTLRAIFSNDCIQGILEFCNIASYFRVMLSNDCIQGILEFCNTKELLSFRLVSKVWRKNATQLLQDRIVSLEDHDVLTGFRSGALRIVVGTKTTELYCKFKESTTNAHSIVHVIFNPGNGTPQISCGIQNSQTGASHLRPTEMLVAKKQDYCPMFVHQSMDLEETASLEDYKESYLTATQQLAFQHLLLPEQSSTTSLSTYEWERYITADYLEDRIFRVRVWSMCLNQDKGVF